MTEGERKKTAAEMPRVQLPLPPLTPLYKGGERRGGGFFRGCHFLYLHSPVQSFFSNHPGGRGLSLP